MDWQISGINEHSFVWGLSESGGDHLPRILAALRRIAGEHAPALKKPELRLLEALNARQVPWEIRRSGGAIRWAFEPWSETPRIEGNAPSLTQAFAQMAEVARRCYGIDAAPLARRSDAAVH